jgi:hypothetical protein
MYNPLYTFQMVAVEPEQFKSNGETDQNLPQQSDHTSRMDAEKQVETAHRNSGN